MPSSGPSNEDFVEEVLGLVERIPIGRVMSYGAIADAIGGGGRCDSDARMEVLFPAYQALDN